MPQAKHITFEIIKQKAIPLNFRLDTIKKYPIHEHYLTEYQKITVVYKYKPQSNLNEEKYIEFLSKKLKKMYNAYSVIVAGSLVNEKKIG